MKRLDVRNTKSIDGDYIWKTKNEFLQTYWSGLDARIYADDILLDEIISLQWQLQEAVMPLFSYASYTYDTVIHGARRVQGAFTINYKQENYLFELLRHLANPGLSRVRITEVNPYVRITETTKSGERTHLRDTEAFRTARTGTATLEAFVAIAGGQNTKLDSEGRFKVDPLLLQQAADDFEAAIWGVEKPASNPRLNSEFAALAIDPKRPRFEVATTFDLNIQFGSVPDDQRRSRQAGSRAENRAQGFHALPVGTSARLIGVAITGSAREIDDSGRPVLESYTFVAKDVL